MTYLLSVRDFSRSSLSVSSSRDGGGEKKTQLWPKNYGAEHRYAGREGSPMSGSKQIKADGLRFLLSPGEGQDEREKDSILCHFPSP
jgi:hypothetical protein